MLRSQHLKANLRRSTVGPRVTAVVSLATTLIFALSRLPGATTVNANSASQSDVAAAIASAADGDTVTIPGGTASWTRTLRVKRGITIQGAGVGSTIIKDSVQSGSLLQVTLVAGKLSRITGIEFQDGGRTTYNNVPGIIHVDGSNTDGSQFRLDHNKFSVNGNLEMDTVIGVADHNTFTTAGRGAFTIFGDNWNNISGGDASWSAPCNFGSSQFFFIEDNTFTNTDTVQQAFASDAYDGARFVFRHNNMVGMIIGDHGTESHGRGRGSRAFEVYNNTMDGNNVNIGVVQSRSSTVLFHDNNVFNYWAYPTPHIRLEPYRCFFPFAPWGGADGVNVWDVNSPTVYFTGTAAANNSGLTVTVSGANWTPNQWGGYTLRRTTNACSSTAQNWSEIRSNTSNTITYTSATFGPEMTICAGDSLEIRKVLHLLDQPGRGQGSLITGNPPVPPAGWNNQVTEPCYAWNNSPQSPVFTPNTAIVRANKHYFDNTPMPRYTPYVYPHPLVNSVRPPEQMTRNAKGNSQHNLRGKRQPWGGKKQDRRQGKKPNENPTNEMAEGQDNPGN
jgi:hypothetical protein